MRKVTKCWSAVVAATVLFLVSAPDAIAENPQDILIVANMSIFDSSISLNTLKELFMDKRRNDIAPF